MSSDDSISLKEQANDLFIQIIKLNPNPKEREAFCRELFYTDKISEELKHKVARTAFRVKPVTQWAYANVKDEELFYAIARLEPLKLSFIPHLVQNKNLSWGTLIRLMYLDRRTKDRAKVRARLLEQLPDEYYAKYSAEFVKLVHSQHGYRVRNFNIIERVKKANDMEGAPDEWLYSVFPPK